MSLAKPLVATLHDGRCRVIAAVDRAARSSGLYPGMALAQAQAMIPNLTVVTADLEGDARALDDLATWCLRYAPLTVGDRPNGVWIDASGAAHLFGGENNMLNDLVTRLARNGFTARSAIADTPGAAWAVARYANAPVTVVPVGDTAATLRSLPVAALRLPPDTVTGLAELGFERIEQIMAAPRAPFTQRFGPVLMQRLDQALGHLFEPINPLTPLETVCSRLAFPDPLLTAEALVSVISLLTMTVCSELTRREVGARRLDLVFERVDNARQVIRIGTARPTREVRHLARLQEEKLEQVDPGLGIEAMSLSVPLIEPLNFEQPDGGFFAHETKEGEPSVLVDRLINRFGSRHIYRVVPVESDVPERSIRRVAPLGPAPDATWPPALPRPVRLLNPPQPIEAMAMLPDHPPVFFIWRRTRHRIRRADGPERIAGEWWRCDEERYATRDYWQVEDDEGQRFWLYRSGDAVDPATGNLQWFLHGFF